MSDVEREYLTAAEVEQMTGISSRTLEAWRGLRKGPDYYKVGRAVRYKADDIRDFIEKDGPA